MKSWLEDYDIEMYSVHNEIKYVVAERFLRTLKNKYNNTYHRTIKMKPVDVNSSTYIDFNKENNNEGPKFKVCDHARISEYNNIF